LVYRIKVGEGDAPLRVRNAPHQPIFLGEPCAAPLAAYAVVLPLDDVTTVAVGK